MAPRSGNVRAAQLHMGSACVVEIRVITKLVPARVLLHRSFLQPLLAVNCCAGPDNHLELPALSSSATVTKTLVCINHRRE